MANNGNELIDEKDLVDNNEIITEGNDGGDQTSEVEDSVEETDDYKAFSTKNAPVKKLSKYGLSSISKELIKVYNALFNGPDKMPEQIVYFGAPGTGKSFGIDKRLKKMKVQSSSIWRVIFHPDYSYGDFIGGIRPHKDSGGVDYRFEPGPLTKALRCAFENPNKEVYIVIEEINRGNAAAIFGDFFQLLDREKSGRSKYQITNYEVASEIGKNEFLRPFFSDDKIWFPNNLNILCTMNTADQNVFVLDSAFKRRFHMEYVPIEYTMFNNDITLKAYLDETDVFKGSDSLVDIFAGTELQRIVADMDSAGKLKRNWPTFAVLVNATIDIVNQNEGEQISEDKKLGPFFVLLDELQCKSKFADKVIYYLKQDVFKYVDTYFSKSYQTIYKDYVDGKIDPFKLLIPGGY